MAGQIFLLRVHAESRGRGEIEIVDYTMEPFFTGCSALSAPPRDTLNASRYYICPIGGAVPEPPISR